jgi:hypothetical protein
MENPRSAMQLARWAWTVPRRAVERKPSPPRSSAQITSRTCSEALSFSCSILRTPCFNGGPCQIHFELWARGEVPGLPQHCEAVTCRGLRHCTCCCAEVCLVLTFASGPPFCKTFAACMIAPWLSWQESVVGVRVFVFCCLFVSDCMWLFSFPFY